MHRCAIQTRTPSNYLCNTKKLQTRILFSKTETQTSWTDSWQKCDPHLQFSMSHIWPWLMVLTQLESGCRNSAASLQYEGQMSSMLWHLGQICPTQNLPCCVSSMTHDFLACPRKHSPQAQICLLLGKQAMLSIRHLKLIKNTLKSTNNTNTVGWSSDWLCCVLCSWCFSV